MGFGVLDPDSQKCAGGLFEPPNITFHGISSRLGSRWARGILLEPGLHKSSNGELDLLYHPGTAFA